MNPLAILVAIDRQNLKGGLMKGSEAKMLGFMEGADKRYVIPVYQRKYNWKYENCQQLYDDLKKIVIDGRDSHFFGSIVSAVVPNGSKIEYRYYRWTAEINNYHIITFSN